MIENTAANSPALSSVSDKESEMIGVNKNIFNIYIPIRISNCIKNTPNQGKNLFIMLLSF